MVIFNEHFLNSINIKEYLKTNNINKHDGNRTTLLIKAATHGRLNIIKQLLKNKKLDINKIELKNNTNALWWSIGLTDKNLAYKISKLLIKNKINVNNGYYVSLQHNNSVMNIFHRFYKSCRDNYHVKLDKLLKLLLKNNLNYDEKILLIGYITILENLLKHNFNIKYSIITILIKHYIKNNNYKYRKYLNVCKKNIKYNCYKLFYCDKFLIYLKNINIKYYDLNLNKLIMIYY